MRYTPRQPRDDVNVSKEHPLVEAGTLLVGLSLILAGILLLLIFLVEIILFFVSEETEVELFSSWLPEDIVTVAYDDPRLEELEILVARLSRHWPETDYEFRVEINEAAEPNALAFPGGLIVVSTGLLDTVQSENELAFVVGHELGHFRNRDHIRGLGRGVAIGILFAAMSPGDARVGATIADLTLRGFSRRQESAADEFGLEIVQREYGHVAGATHFFERMSVEGGSSGLTTYLSTHPAPADRVDTVIETAGTRGWRVTGELRPLGWQAE